MRIKTGDTVKVLYGKYAGQTGKVLKMIPSKGMVVVEGMNVYKKNIKGDGQSKKSEIITISKPMPVAKVQLVSPDDGKPTRVGYIVKDGDKTRVSKKSGKTLDNAKVVEKKTSAKPKKESTKEESVEKKTQSKQVKKSDKSEK